MDDEASHDSEAEDEDEYSSDEEDEVPTKYINASYVDVNVSFIQSLKAVQLNEYFNARSNYYYICRPLGILVPK